MSIVAVGISHKSAPIEVRERLAIVPARLRDALEIDWRLSAGGRHPVDMQPSRGLCRGFHY